MKKSSVKPKYTTRIEAPVAKKEKDGSAGLYCPFCKPTHRIMPGAESACGTRLEVRAVQMVFKARYEKDMKCVKCGQGGGEMVLFRNAFIHVHDCTPGVAALTEEPKFTPLARIVYSIPWPSLKTRVNRGKYVSTSIYLHICIVRRPHRARFIHSQRLLHSHRQGDKCLTYGKGGFPL